MGKLSADQVADIRQQYAAGNVRLVDLAPKFGVTATMIGYVVTGQSPRPKRSALQRFTTKYRVDAAGCWLWTAYLSPDGYGRFLPEGGQQASSTMAHRWAYEHFIGPLRSGLTIDHLCRVRSCVNPEHMEPVTHAENIARRDHTYIGLRNGAKTHCCHGHAFTPENTKTYSDKLGGMHRQCLTCGRERRRQRTRLIAS